MRHAIGTLAVLVASLAATASASAATSVIAAYEKFVPGQGFDIGLVDTGTGAAIAVPAGVNTSADELHPALSSDGRWLVFSRMTLTPQLNGNVVPPAERAVFRVDRTKTDQPVVLGDRGVGPTSTALNRVTWGQRIRVAPTFDVLDNDILKFATLSGDAPTGVGVDTNPPFGNLPSSFNQPGTVKDVTSAVSMAAGTGGGNGAIMAYQAVLFSDATGDVTKSQLLVEAREPASCCGFFNGLPFNFTAAENTGHPALRTIDKYLAFDESTTTDGTGGGSIKSVLLGQPTADPAPDPINTDDDERQPAWSPDATRLAFVRTGATGPRRLFVFNLAPGIQTIVNPGLDIGAVAPNAQLRRFQNIWGGISLAIETRPDAANPTCDLRCRSALIASSSGVQLSPAVSAITSTTTKKKKTTGLQIGIVVARITGTRKVLGRTVPKLRPVGRVPLGAAVQGRNAFRWDGRVGGKRLPAGRYALTFRTLTKAGRVHSLSETVRFTLSASGRISAVRRVML